jgi:hypothetical protein
MSEMVERAIKAGEATGLDFADWAPRPQEELVRAIIAAMREPTKDMVDAGQIRCHGVSMADGRSPVCGMYLGDGAATAWERMIDEALR